MLGNLLPSVICPGNDTDIWKNVTEEALLCDKLWHLNTYMICGIFYLFEEKSLTMSNTYKWVRPSFRPWAVNARTQLNRLTEQLEPAESRKGLVMFCCGWQFAFPTLEAYVKHWWEKWSQIVVWHFWCVFSFLLFYLISSQLYWCLNLLVISF